MMHLLRHGMPAVWLGLIGIAIATPARAPLAQPVDLPAVPLCSAPARPTPAQTEGPFYKGNSPRRHVLVSPGQPGERMVLTGFVLTRSCRPVPGVVVDVWQANARGVYDNAGFNLRGHEITDQQGRYWFETIVPAEYPGRTRHIHLKILVPGRGIVTTQVYFPNEPQNARDAIFDPALIMKIGRAEGRTGPVLIGRYDFIPNMP